MVTVCKILSTKKLGYEINSRDYWENFIFRIKNNLTSHKQIGNDPNYRDFKVQLALYKKKSCVVNYPEDIVYGKNKLIQLK